MHSTWLCSTPNHIYCIFSTYWAKARRIWYHSKIFYLKFYKKLLYQDSKYSKGQLRGMCYGCWEGEKSSLLWSTATAKFIKTYFKNVLKDGFIVIGTVQGKLAGGNIYEPYFCCVAYNVILNLKITSLAFKQIGEKI